MFFKINDKLAIGAEVYETRRSWGHKAHLYRVRTPEQNDLLIESTRITYYNRTWERFQFESILFQLIEKARRTHAIDENEAKVCNDYIKSYNTHDSHLKTVAIVAKLGDLFSSNKKEANDWKTRMIKAGLENKGLIMPDDWEELSESEKETRLNGAIAQLAQA